MLLLTLFLPLLNFVLFVGFSRLLRPVFIASINILGLFFVVARLFLRAPWYFGGNTDIINLGTWIVSGLFEVSWVFCLDALTYAMLFTVLLVSACVHLYSIGYMRHDPHFSRFMSYLSLFTFFMLILVTANNFLILFLGWEGVGLSSYLLIGFWYARVQASKAAFKAMIVNRISDAALTLGILGVFRIFGTLDFGPVFASATYIGKQYTASFSLTCATMLLFMGAMGKSAQLGLHTWLPDAMEGPTPVSALIHAATMVTAGIFLIVRCSPLFECTPRTLLFMLLIGSITAFAAATIGLVQDDVKKIIAYSTCSQLGYMVLVCGLSGYTLSLFHLVNHAFFKALLFLAAGALIHAMSDEQDLRRMGGLAKLLPFTMALFVVGSAALIAMPFLTGFYSKDLILEIALYLFTPSAGFAYSAALLAAAFTASYSARLILFAFFGSNNGSRLSLLFVHEAPLELSVPLTLLASGSIFGGYLLHEVFSGVSSIVWNGAISSTAAFSDARALAENLPFYVRYLPVGAWFFPVIFVFTVLYDDEFFNFFYQKWHFDNIYNWYVNTSLLEWAYDISFTLIDKGLLEYVGPSGFAIGFLDIGKRVNRYQTGLVYDYAGFFVFVLYSVLLILVARPVVFLY